MLADAQSTAAGQADASQPLLDHVVGKVSCRHDLKIVWAAANEPKWWHAQAQGIEAIAPDLLSTRPEYPLQVEMTPLPPKKRSRSTVGAAAAAVQPAATQDIVTAQPGAVQDVATAQPGAVQDDLDAQPGALQDDFIAL